MAQFAGGIEQAPADNGPQRGKLIGDFGHATVTVRTFIAGMLPEAEGFDDDDAAEETGGNLALELASSMLDAA